MKLLLPALVLVVPLAWSSRFSDFDLPKWGILSAGALVATLMSLRVRTQQSRLPMALLALAGLMSAASLVARPAGGMAFELPILDLCRILTLACLAAALLAAPATAEVVRRVACFGLVAPILVLAVAIIQEREWLEIGLPYRPGGWTATLGNSGVTGLFALTSLAFVPLAGRMAHGRPAQTILTSAAIAAPLTLIYRSESRAALVGAVIVGIVAIATRERKREPATATNQQRLGLGVALLLAVIPATLTLLALSAPAPLPDPSERVASIAGTSHPSNTVRLHLWSDALEMVREHPILGVGGGRFGEIHDRFRDPEEWAISGFQSRVEHPHQEYLRLAAEYGIPLTLGALALVAVAVFRLLGMLRSRTWLDRSLTRAALCAVAAGLWAAASWDVVRQPATVTPILVLMSLALSRRERDEVAGSALAPRILGLAGCTAAAVGWATWLHADVQDVTLLAEIRGAKSKANAAAAERDGSSDALERIAELSRRLTDHLLEAPRPPWRRHRLATELLDFEEQARAIESIAGSRAMTENPERARRARELVDRFAPITEARRALRRAHDRSPLYTPLIEDLARLERTAARTSEAVGWLEEAIAINPATPRARLVLADVYLTNGLTDRAVEAIRTHLSTYGSTAAGDPAWEKLARTLGYARRLIAGVSAVEEWCRIRGETEARLAVAGELTLHFGETDETTGLFIAGTDAIEARNERGAFAAGRTAGSPPAVRRSALLAHLARHPFDTPALDALAESLRELNRGRSAAVARHLRDQRDRAIARSKALYAWEHHLLGDRRLFRISLHAARTKNPRLADPYLLEVVAQLEARRADEARETIRRWRSADFDPWEPLGRHPATLQFREDPEVLRILGRLSD